MCYNWFAGTSYIQGFLEKFSKSGQLEWSNQFPNYPGQDQRAFDVLEKAGGGYYALVEDSMFTIDILGNVVNSTSAINGRKIMELTNGDLLVLDQGNTLYRSDTLGNIIWSHNCDGFFDYDTAHVFILNSNSSIMKVDALSGAQIWNRNYGYFPVSDIEATHDGGFLASIGYKPTVPYGYAAGTPSPGILFRADSLGDTLWTRNYTLPYYGLSAFSIVGANILTGGCYLSWLSTSPYKDHSAFICMMNADGSFPLQQTDYMVPSDADDNHYRNFVDDALATMLALGKTGIPRNTSLDSVGTYCDRVDIAIDWQTSSACGIDNKYADCDGNGIIDTNDIKNINNIIYCIPDSLPLYYRLGGTNQNQSIEEFSLVPVNDTILPGEDAYFYMILGSSGNPVDSIYGFALSYFIGEWGLDHADSATFYSSTLGTPGINMWAYHNYSFVTMNLQLRTHTMICRTDFQI
jgi:hypothetical protein